MEIDSHWKMLKSTNAELDVTHRIFFEAELLIRNNSFENTYL
ncbi:hypothetical protein [Algoriphagus boritolerans]